MVNQVQVFAEVPALKVQIAEAEARSLIRAHL